MRGKEKRLHAYRPRRGIAAAFALLALCLQFVAPSLPMPAMGGLTSIQMSAMPLCRDMEPGEHGKSQDHRSDGKHCPICVVVAQAGSTLAPVPIVVPGVSLAEYAERTVEADAPRLSSPAVAFSSRAPPQAA